jgi:hypothetical protein
MESKNRQIRFLIALFIMGAMLLSCSKIKELVSDKEKSTKEETKEETKKETTKESTKEKTKEEDRSDSGTKTSSGNRLYFCEDYLQGEEVNVAKTFTTGRLTVMVKLTDKIYDKDVFLKLEKLNDDGTKKEMNTISFTIPDGDYFFFKHKELGFSKPGLYRVTMLDKHKSPIVSGEVVITSGD